MLPLSRTNTPEKTIPVAEIFGPTIQGEGRLAGLPTYFLRIGGCDYACVWCDSDHAVVPAQVRQLKRWNQQEIYDEIEARARAFPGPDWLAISGGNPALYDLSKIIEWWQGSGNTPEQRKVTVETQGTKWQHWFTEVDCLTISPKGPSSGLSAQQSGENLEGFMANVQNECEAEAVLKVVVFDDKDYDFAKAVHNRWPGIEFHLSTGTAMGGLSGRWVPPLIPDEDLEEDPFIWYRDPPEGMTWAKPAIDTKEHLLRRYRWLSEKAMNDPDMADVAVGVQLHTLLWGIETRGV